MNSGNPQFERDFEAFLESDDSRLDALYRKLPQPEPDARLDAAVRALAQRAVAATARTPVAAHRRWLPVFSVAAVVALAAGIAFQIRPQLWQRPASQPGAEPASVPSAPPAPAVALSAQKASAATAATAAPAAHAPAAEMKTVENAASRSMPRAFPAPARAMRETPPTAALEVKPPMPAATMAAPMRAKQQVDMESAGAPAHVAPAEKDSNATLYPEHWLANIRQMLRDNQREGALRSLEKFRKTYPAYPLPDDLRDLH
ncbi:MAG: hypothetical protein KGI64_07165 [Xanthomonadaceae bacterium]|nr:hypothetical protein [Xanthomonadaceae bacterium]